MSTEFVPVEPIHADRFWEGVEAIEAMEGSTLREEGDDGDPTGTGWVTDGENHLEVNYCTETFNVTFTRYGANDVDLILDTLAAYFHVEIIDEYDDRFEEVVERHYPDAFLDPEDFGGGDEA